MKIIKKQRHRNLIFLLHEWYNNYGDSQMSLGADWRKFILNEEMEEKTIFTYIQGLQEIINNFRPRTMTEKRRFALAKQQIKEVKRLARRMQNEVHVLQEKLNILEESLNENEER